MNSDFPQLLAIIADTKKLIDLAENSEWDELVVLEKTRDVAVKTLFVSPPDIEAEKLAKGIQYILARNKILLQYSHSQCDSLRMEMSKAGHAHKAIDSYLTT